MFKSFKSLAHALILTLLAVGISGPARAQWAVIDAANLVQATKEVVAWGQQLQGMVQQYNQLVYTYNSITGARGMQLLLPISIAERNYLPANYTQLQGVMNGTSTTYAPLAGQVQSNVQTNAVLTPAQVATLSPQAQSYLNNSRRSAATLAMLSQQTQANASNNFSTQQGFISALGATTDTKASADLAGRIQSEQLMVQTNHIKTDALYQTVQAQQLQNAQTARELSVQSLGHMSTLGALQW
jgi:type IV secretion system protein VirB5